MSTPSSPSSSFSSDPEGHLLDRFLAEHPDGDLERLDGWLPLQPETAADAELGDRVRKALADWQRAGSLFARALPGPEVGGGLAPGQIVGDFRLVRFVARGAMGQVWEAAQLSLGERRVALKLILPGKLDERSLALFEREARAGGRLQHPGIVNVHGYGVSAGLSWIAMEFVAGGRTLRDHLAELARLGTLPKDHDREVARLVAEIADAMQVAHDAGVIHRDLKPQNVLLTRVGAPKVSDFGLARILDEPSQSDSGQQVGTFLYMSPEQVAAQTRTVDHRADVFSLGVVLYELLTLQRPFQGDTTLQIAEQIRTKDPLDPRMLRSTLARDLAVIVGKALEKERERRFQTMSEFAADLRRFLAHEPIRAKPPAPPVRVAKWVRRNRIATLSFLLAAVMAGGAASLLWLQQQRRISNVLADAQSAARRDEVDACMSQLERARELEARIPLDLRIYEVDALIASRQTALALAKLEEWLAEAGEAQEGRALLRQGMLTLEKDEVRGEALLGQALTLELGEADRLLAQALRASTVPECLLLLTQAVESEPRSYLPRMVLGPALLVGGRLEEAERAAKSMLELFPRDPRGRLVLNLIALLRAEQRDKPEIQAWARSISPDTESLFDAAELAGKILSLEALMGRPIDEERNELDLVRELQEGPAREALLSFMPRIPCLFRASAGTANGLRALAEGRSIAEVEQLLQEALDFDPENGVASYLLAAARLDREANGSEEHAEKMNAALDAFQDAAEQPCIFPAIPVAASIRNWEGRANLGTASRIQPDPKKLVEARRLIRDFALGEPRPAWIYEHLLNRAVLSKDRDLAEMAALALRRDHPDRPASPDEMRAALLTRDWYRAVGIVDLLMDATPAEEDRENLEELRREAIEDAAQWLDSYVSDVLEAPR